MYKRTLLSQLRTIKRKIQAISRQQKLRASDVVLQYRANYVLVINNKNEWFAKMRQLHEIYWSWINSRNIRFNYNRFINVCRKLWSELSSPINFKVVYNKYKNLEKKIPRSHAIIKKRGFPSKILLVKHHNNNLWSLPGGKLEKDENHYSALMRELYEEIGFKRNGHIYSSRNFGNNKCYVIWTSREKFSTNSPYEIEKVKWFDVNKLPPHTKLLREYIKSYENLINSRSKRRL